MYLGMIAFVIVGYQLIKDKKKTKKVITSVLAITTFGTAFNIPVEAFSDLANYNTIHNVLDTQPNGQIVIPGYEFIGYLPATQNIFVEKNEKVIHFDEEIEFDNQLNANQKEIKVVGKNGKEIIEEHYYVLNDEKVIFNQIINREEPITQIIRVGTKSVVENGITTEIVEKNFEEVIEYDANLWADTFEVLQEGISGKELVKTNADGTVIEKEVLVEKQDRKIKRGTKPLLGIERSSETKEIDFETDYLYDNSKYRDEEIVEVQGEKGLQEIITTYQTFKGIRQDNPFIRINEIKPKVNKVIRVGTKEINTQEVEKETEVTPFNEKVILDENLWEDAQEVITVGKDKIEEVITTYDLIRGIRQANPKVETKLVQPLEERVVKKGTKSILGEIVEKEVQEIQFETKYIYDNNKYVDEEHIEKNGVVGKKEITTTYKTIKDVKQPNPTVVENEIKPKINQLIRKGTLSRLQPTINIVKLEEKVNAENRVLEINDDLAMQSVVIDTQIVNNGHTLRNAKYRLLKNNTEVVTDMLSQEISLNHLEYYQEYDLVVEAEYDEQGVQKTITHNQKFKLIPPRKIEIKDADRYELVKYENNNKMIITQLDAIPDNLGAYFVRITSDRYKTILLPIEKITYEQDKYRVLANIPDLVENRNGYESGHDFYIEAKKVSDQNVYTDFKSLVEAMKQTPNGTFIIGSTLNASHMPLVDGSESYFGNNDFTGTLIGEHNGSRYAIQDLKYPLFSKLIKATIKNLDLINANIKLNQSEVGALAKYSSESTIQDVHVNGNVQGLNHVGGIIARSRLTNFKNVSMVGTVKGTTTLDIDSDVGGITGYMTGGTLEQAYADVYASIHGRRGGSRLGAIVGRAGESRPRINKVYAKGTVENTGNAGQVGGLIGSLWNSGAAANLVSEVNVVNGNIIYGDFGDKNPALSQAYVVDGKANGNTHNKATTIESDEVESKLNQLAITKPRDLVLDSQANEITYTELKYRNAELFTPFYLKDFIIHQGNKIIDADILSKEIVSITPLQNMSVITDSKDAANINKILVHFKDGKIKYYNAIYKTQENSYLAEFDIPELGIVYTLDTIHSNVDSVIADVLNEFKSVEYYSDSLAKKINAYSESEVAQAINATTTEEQARKNIVLDKMRKLFLYDEFFDIKVNLEQILPKLIISDKMISGHNSVIQEDIKQKLIENKEYILMALTYLSRWYNIDFTSTNIKELVLYHQDFYGKDIETVDFLIDFGKLGYDNLRLKLNVETYKTVLSNNTGKETLFNYFDDLREKFTTLQANDWFKQTSKAYIKEATPLSNNYMNVKIYDKMTKNNSPFKEMVLPLLTAQEGIYAISSMNTILFGMFDRYMNMDLKEGNPIKYETEVERVKGLVDRATIWHRDYYGYWYRIVEDAYKPKLERNLLSWDGYSTNRGWISYHNANQAVKDFFGPIEKLYNSNGSGAYANGTIVHFVVDKALDQYGSSVFTHEMVHNNDGAVYFNGAGRRNRLGAEYFALGLLQVPNNFNHALLGINQMFDYTVQKDNLERVHAVHPNRYQNTNDLKVYFERMFDVLYTLDYAEGEVITTKTAEQQRKLLAKMTTYMEGHLPGNNLSLIPDGARYQSVHELIDNHITTRRGFGLKNDVPNNQSFKVNGYYQIPIFDPAYAAGENDVASAGDVMFKRMAFELLAYKGWEDGFLPFVSTKLQKQAYDSGYGDVNMPDGFVIKIISGGQYTSMIQFKKAMFDQRYDNRHRLKSVVIRWNNQDVTIDSYDKIKQLLDEATNTDLQRGSTNARTLKRLIFNAYLRKTDDFRDSIYEN